MIKSMTGYGRHKELTDGREIMFEIRSVNNRYLDLSVRMPRLYAPLLSEEVRPPFVRSARRG